MEEKKEAPTINIKFPTKKIIFVGVMMIIFMIVLEVSGKYIRWGVLLQNIYSYNIYITYVLVSVILIVLIFFFVRCFGKKKECKEEDIKEVLKVIDKLLEKLPEKELNKFSKTKDAELYKSVLRKYGIR